MERFDVLNIAIRRYSTRKVLVLDIQCGTCTVLVRACCISDRVVLVLVKSVRYKYPYQVHIKNAFYFPPNPDRNPIDDTNNINIFNRPPNS